MFYRYFIINFLPSKRKHHPQKTNSKSPIVSPFNNTKENKNLYNLIRNLKKQQPNTSLNIWPKRYNLTVKPVVLYSLLVNHLNVIRALSSIYSLQSLLIRYTDDWFSSRLCKWTGFPVGYRWVDSVGYIKRGGFPI